MKLEWQGELNDSVFGFAYKLILGINIVYVYKLVLRISLLSKIRFFGGEEEEAINVELLGIVQLIYV